MSKKSESTSFYISELQFQPHSKKTIYLSSSSFVTSFHIIIVSEKRY